MSPKSEAEAPGVIKPSLPASRRPRVSVFSPSHQTRYLDDCMRSLLAQTYQDWEWIVLLNQGARWRPPTEDPRLRVVIKDDLTGVGAAKRYACSLALGEFLVELDHDDELRSDALQLIVDAFDANPQVGFVFSDFAQINEDGSRDDSRFDQSNGWVYEEDTVDGRSVLRCRSLEASPHNVSYIWFAPNHVRAFRRAIYEMTGGYDATRDVLDDQDIMCRLYQLTEFHLIDECLYLQRMHRTNTQREIEINARIQRETVALYDRYIEPNALAWASRRGLTALYLGPAEGKPPGYLGVDTAPGDGRRRRRRRPQRPRPPRLERGRDPGRRFPPARIGQGGALQRVLPPPRSRRPVADPDTQHGREGGIPGPHARLVTTTRTRSGTSPIGTMRGSFPGSTAGSKSSRLVTYFPGEWHETHKIPYVCANFIAIKDGPRQGGLLKI